MRRPEQLLHQAVARYLDLALPADSWWTTIPLGGGGRLRGAILNGMGAKKGAPDIFIVYEGRAHFIELKAKRGALTDAQIACHKAIMDAFCPVVRVCRSIGEVEAVLKYWNIPVRARVAA